MAREADNPNMMHNNVNNIHNNNNIENNNMVICHSPVNLFWITGSEDMAMRTKFAAGVTVTCDGA